MLPRPNEHVQVLAFCFLPLCRFCSSTAPGAGIDGCCAAAIGPLPAGWYPADNDVTYTSAARRGAPFTATLIITWRLASA